LCYHAADERIQLQKQKPSGIFSGPKGPKNQFLTAVVKAAAYSQIDENLFFKEEKVMQKRKVFMSKAIILTFASLVLWGIILVDVAKAGSPPLTVNLGLPSSVNFGQGFNISVAVTNNTATPININKIAVGYGLEILRFRGPYEVILNSPVDVQPFQSKSFIVPFKITSGSGTVVGMVVILAHDEYTGANLLNNVWYGVVGSAAGGVKVN
jgi:hypothetical protein